MFTFLSFILLDLLEQTRSIWLVTPPPSSGLLSWTLEDPRVVGWCRMPPNASWLSTLSAPATAQFLSLCVCLCLGDEAGDFLCMRVLKCVIARHKRPLISALRQPLAQPSNFLKCPAVFNLTYQVNVSLSSYPSSSWIITDFILTCVFNRLILLFYLRRQ